MKFILFLFLSVNAVTASSFASDSSESDPEEPYISRNLKDISFQTVRDTISLKELQAHNRQYLIFDFLFFFTAYYDEASKAILHDPDFPKSKRGLFQFLLLNSNLQKKALKQSSKIRAWIDSKIQARDASYFKELEFMRQLDPNDALFFMPHLFLSLGDKKIIESVFKTEGFDPYLRTSLGHNLLHSFILFTWIKNFLGGGLDQNALQESLELLIEKSPPELLTQKNDLFFTPIALSVFLRDFTSYEIFMKTMPPRVLALEIPYLEKEIIKQGLYNFLELIYDFRLKFNFFDQFAAIGDKKQVLLALDDKKDLKKQEPFMTSEAEKSIVKFNFMTLIDSSASSTSMKFEFNEFQKYESRRLAQIGEIFFNDPNQKNLKSLYKALFDKDILALQNFFLKLNGALNKKETAQIVLEESIRSQFTKGVLFSIDILKNTDTAAYDSVFLSLLNYASLSGRHTKKKEAKEIIRILTSAKFKEGELLSSHYIYWSVYFGLTEELKYFIEETNLILDSEAAVYAIKYAQEQDYIKIYNYLTRQIKNNPEIPLFCRDIFLN